MISVVVAKERPELWLEENKGLIESIVNSFHFDTPKFAREDLVQEANMAAVYAIGKYDINSSASLSTYVYTAVRRTCRDFVRRNKHDLYMSSYQQDKEWKNRLANPVTEQEHSLPKHIFASVEGPMAVRSDAPLTTVMDVSFGETIPSGEIGLLDALIKKEQVSILMEELNTLPEREQVIICARFFENKTLEEIASTQGCSRQRIKIVNDRAMNRLATKVKERLEDELLI
jgi:RNA polymerase sigma factor (sigma-70 family)